MTPQAVTRHSNPNPLVMVALAISLASLLVLSACAPTSTTSASLPEAYLGTYQGPFESAAVLLGEDLRSSYSVDFNNQLYTQTLIQLLRHPYYRSRFDLVERRQLDEILAELDLGGTPYADTVTALRLGELLGARYLIIVEVLQASAEEGSIFLNSLVGVPVSASGYDVRLSVAMRIIDGETGRVLGVGLGEEATLVPSSLVVQGQGLVQDQRESALLDRVPDAVFRAANDMAVQIDQR